MGASVRPVVLRLPDRVSALDLGKRRVSKPNTGGREAIEADELIIDRMIERALNRQTFQDVRELYAILDAEEDDELSRPNSDYSPYMRRKFKSGIKEFILFNLGIRDQLAKLGLAQITRDGGVQLDERVHQQIKHR
jgi:hypothetical protein